MESLTENLTFPFRMLLVRAEAVERKRTLRAQGRVDFRQLGTIGLLNRLRRIGLFIDLNTKDSLGPIIQLHEDTYHAGVSFLGPGAAETSLVVAGRTRPGIEDRPEPISGVATLITMQPFPREEFLACSQALLLLVWTKTSPGLVTQVSEDPSQKHDDSKTARVRGLHTRDPPVEQKRWEAARRDYRLFPFAGQPELSGR